METYLHSDIIWIIGQHLSFAELKAYSGISREIRTVILDTWLDRCKCVQKHCPKHIRNLIEVTDGRSLSRYEGLKSIIFANHFNPQYTVFIPNTVTRLEFGLNFDRPVNIPQSVTYLKFGMKFDRPVVIPNSVTRLIFSYFFNKPVIIPDSVVNLAFGYQFDKLVDIPRTVTHLTCGKKFFDIGRFPKSITHLYLETMYDNECKNYATDSIGCVYGNRIVETLANRVPNTVTHLICGYNFVASCKEPLPDSITHLYITEPFNYPLPNSVIHLYIKNDAYHKIDPPKSYSTVQSVQYPDKCMYFCLGKRDETIYDHSWLTELMK